MKKYGRLGLAMLVIGIFALGSRSMSLAAGPAPQAQVKASESSVSITAVTEPVDLAKLPPPLYLGATPAPSKNGPFGIIQTASLSASKPAPALVVRWFDTQQQALAAIRSLAPGSIVEGVLWENAPPSGRSLAIYGANCNNNGIPNLGGSLAFDNITSSLDNSCGSATLYFDPNYGGPQQSYPNGRTNNVGPGMNDQASSVFFKP